jgi:hypothetical protein
LDYCKLVSGITPKLNIYSPAYCSHTSSPKFTKQYTIRCKQGPDAEPLYNLKIWDEKLKQKFNDKNKGSFGQVVFDTYKDLTFKNLFNFLLTNDKNYIEKHAYGRKFARFKDSNLRAEATSVLLPDVAPDVLRDRYHIWPTDCPENQKKARLYTRKANQGDLKAWFCSSNNTIFNSHKFLV